jgi:hypothetical protein
VTAPGLWNRAALLRDVTVNLIANVLWWSGAYLAGAAAGVLPRSPYLIISTAALILGAVSGVLVLAVMGMTARGRPPGTTVVLISLGISGVFLALAAFGSGPLRHPAQWIVFTMGVLLIGVTLIGVSERLREDKVVRSQQLDRAGQACRAAQPGRPIESRTRGGRPPR